jgi:hypothetical protein
VIKEPIVVTRDEYQGVFLAFTDASRGYVGARPRITFRGEKKIVTARHGGPGREGYDLYVGGRKLVMQ